MADEKANRSQELIKKGRDIAAEACLKMVFVSQGLDAEKTGDEYTTGMGLILTDIYKQFDNVHEVFEEMEELLKDTD